ncbi:hypothetical protein QFC19_003680 [Naganishia cerealis]|uniref:Uncharacterized protein n=1 Tax=Naganishia cerealis TaxID=610337 RepID=A0ACC2W0Y5_9TREE|nr:hypothetical protein QFC19_003680 [Naganishia cerealis]
MTTLDTSPSKQSHLPQPNPFESHNMPVPVPTTPNLPAVTKPAHSTSTTIADIISSLSLPEKVFALSGSGFSRTNGLPAHNLHKVKVSDSPTDIRGDTVFGPYGSAVFPNATCVAATFDVETMQRLGEELAEECKLKSVDTLLAPTINLHRDPRGGRNQESPGEDPFLAGQYASAFVRGVQSRGVGACLKHLVCNDGETDRRLYDSIVSDNVLREVYLRPFEIAVKEANPRSVMTAYNKINGKSAAENPHTIGIVRNEWNYPGLIISDWFGTYDGVESVKAGLDLEMPFPAARGPKLLQAIKEGRLSEELVNERLTKVIEFIKANNSPKEEDRMPEQSSPLGPSERGTIIRQAAADGMLLLKNDGILPINSETVGTVAVIGSLATDRVLAHLIRPSYIVSPLEGLQTAFSAHPDKLQHAHGVQTHKMLPILGAPYTDHVSFTFWNRGDRTNGGTSAAVETDHEAHVAILLRPIPGLDKEYEIEMNTTITVQETGKYLLSVVACSDAEVFINGRNVYTFVPKGVMDIQQQLFYSADFEQTFEFDFEVGKKYAIQVIAQSQKQVGHEPVGQGLRFGIVKQISREDSLRQAVKLAKSAEVVLCFVGTTAEWEMEGIDRKDLTLPAGQEELIGALLKANQNVVIVNQSGAAVDLSCARNARAILHAHFCGYEAGNAIADVLLGKTNPSGRLPFTWPVRLEDVASFGNFPRADDLSLRYAEGLFMGYRHFDKTGAPEPAFAFGHGLSYTTFEFAPAILSGSVTPSGKLVVEVDITNTGAIAGRDVVQLYVSAPFLSERPIQSLEAFAKTRVLDPGQSERVKLELNKRSFSTWSEQKNCWHVARGRYELRVSRSSRDIAEKISVKVDDDFDWHGI